MIPITFANLTYTEQGYSNTAFPLGIALVASYAKKILMEKIKIELFQYPEDFSEYLRNNRPKIACFSNYSWTIDLSHEYAKKIKEKYPDTIIIFGGPNFPIEKEEQKNFLKEYPAIDFYIRCEGEFSFVELFLELEKYDFDAKKFKEKKLRPKNITYIHEDELVSGEILPRIRDLNEIPSPYLDGMLDKFFDNRMVPVIQTTRGCPFNCSYCQEGGAYFCIVKRFSTKRIVDELNYISKRTKVATLIITDSNFGMYEEDVEICKIISEIRKKTGWPKYIDGSSGKNKDTMIEAIKALDGGFTLGAPVQSTNEKVLEAINRKNISMERIIELTKTGGSLGGKTFSEIILGLPMDTKEAHIKSMMDMIDLDINVVRSHQFLMLPGSEASTKNNRKKYQMETRYRLQPRCFGNYNIIDEIIPCSEIDELCISNSTMSYDDYLKCRSFDLTVEIFYNDSVVQELINFLKQYKISPSSFIGQIHEKITETKLNELYNDFIEENKNCIWQSKEELKKHIKNKEMIDKYIKENLRNNEQLKYKALGFFYKMKLIHDISFDSSKKILKENSLLGEKEEEYLNELYSFSLLRKENLLNLELKTRKKFKFNFIEILKRDFEANPLDYETEGIEIEFYLSDDQKNLFKSYIQQYGESDNSLGIILSRSQANKFYRQIRLISEQNSH